MSDELNSGSSNPIETEHQVLDFWKEHQCFDRLREKNKNGPVFRFLDGPITANNPMGVHHVWGRTLKDVFLRYKAMHGHTSNWQNGFDSQGLWVEVEVEREKQFKGKKEIEEFGIENFIRLCQKRVEKYSTIQTDQSIRLGQWMDWEHSYFTHTDANIQGIWHFLKKCHENGWLHQGDKLLPWCPRCGTSLSEHEMTGSYRDMEHTSVYVQLPVVGKDFRILLWTTTPWTLPANVAAAVHPDIDYCEVLLKDQPDPVVLAKGSIGGIKEYKPQIQREFKGSELLDLRFETFFPDLDCQKTIEHRIIPWNMIDPAEGSGIVHIAPGCGAEDLELGRQHGLPILEPVDEVGTYTEGYSWLTGKKLKDVAEPLIENLKSNNKLVKSYPHAHRYPVCWRCKTETFFRLVKEWFIQCDEIRPRMVKATQSVRWEPPYMMNRMLDWLSNMSDWNISRKRFYGLPLPFYPCTNCGELTVVGSKQELRELAGPKVDRLPELHRPWIDSVQIQCPKCKSQVSRIPEVGDVWLDAGIVPFSTLGYFEDQEKWNRYYPAEWITEMREQVRLWFYSMLFMSVTLKDKAPYEKVLAYESVIAEDGSRFSKTGFMIHFDEAVEKMGADVMRYLFCAAPVTSNVRFGYLLGDEVRRRLITFSNICSFFVTYARLDLPEIKDFTPQPENLTVTDRWLLVRTNAFLAEVTAAMESYTTPSVIRAFESYIEDLSTWYVRVNRRRFWKYDGSPDSKAAYWCLYHALRVATQAIAPVIPFMTEKIWQDAIRLLDEDAPLSVHLSDWPKPLPAFDDETLLRETESVRAIVSVAHSLRKQVKHKVRQPLACFYVITDEKSQAAVEKMRAILIHELNVKEIRFPVNRKELESQFVLLDFKKAGPVLKKDVSQVQQIMKNLNPEQMADLVNQLGSGQEIQIPGWPSSLPADIFILKSEPKEGIAIASDNAVTVGFDTRLTESLVLEGLARDLVRQIQVLRKDSGLKVEEHIHLGIQSDSDFLNAAVSAHKEYISEEVLADRIETTPDETAILSTVDISGHEAKISIRSCS